MGYLYCETRRVLYDEDTEVIVERYKEIAGREGWFSELSQTFKFDSVNKYKKTISYNNYYANCRMIRNDLSHRFFKKEITSSISEKALISVCDMMTRACKVVYDLMPIGPDRVRIAIIIDSMEFPLRTVGER